MSPKFTVIIPTRERSRTLFHTLRTVAEQEYDNLSIIVSDNFSRDATQEVVVSIRDPRILYVNTGKRVSMSENFEFGLSHVNGGFVLFLGDDDGLLPGAIARVHAIVQETGLQAVASGLANYCWPDHPDARLRNKMSWAVRSDVEIRKSSEWLKKVLRFETMYTFDLPGTYLGFVHYDAISRMKKNGRFYYSQTPDAYAAFACACAVEQYAFSHRPFAIHGSSGRSNGASQLTGCDDTEAEKFKQENTMPFHSSLRWCPSYHVIKAESFLQLKNFFPEVTDDYSFNLRDLLAAALNERTEPGRNAIDRAVAEMASINGVTMDDVTRRSRALMPRLRHALYQGRNLLPLRARYSGIPDASTLAVSNIYDAAKTMNVFLALNEGAVTSRYRRYARRAVRMFRGNGTR